ncbi:MAG: elongation factor G [Candidatus Omnitrophica bacterium]|nr:elongation factor G [Candidatus Omnitrophota bacterium]
MSVDLRQKFTFLLCGHAQTGKTSLAESLLYTSGASSRLGKVDDGTSVSDYEDDEKERKSSINLSVLSAEGKGYSFQFIDVPGYLDFVGELYASIRAVDFVIIVIDASSGIEVGTEKAWEIARRENLPCLFFINKVDKATTDFNSLVKDIHDTISKETVPISVVENGQVKGVIENKEQFADAYGQIIEKVAESDDALLEKYLETGTLDENEFVPALRKAIVNSKIFPVLGGIATEEIGTQFLIDFIRKEMPSVAEALPRRAKASDGQEVTIEPKGDGDFAAQVFKTVIDPFVGQLSIFRVFSGTLAANSEMYNVNTQTKEKVSQIFSLEGKQQLTKDSVSAGDIAAIAKLKDTHTNNTLCSASGKFEFSPLPFPSPVYSASVKPKTRKDEEKISSALSRLTSEDPTFRVGRDEQTKELIISGMGELHLHVIIERMKRKYGANVDLGTPKVPYRETITKPVKVQSKYKKQTGGHGQYGDVWIEIEPLERGKDFEFVDKIVGGAIPRNFIPSVEKGVRKAMQSGILAGFPLSDIRVILFDGSYHPVDSSDMSFQIAGSMAVKKALEQTETVIIEPIMNVEIIVPEEFMGQITGDINSRRGRVMGMEMKGKNEVVKAKIPLAEMFKYASDLRSVTGGRGTYTMQFSHYDVVPQRIAQAIIQQAQDAKKEE